METAEFAKAQVLRLVKVLDYNYHSIETKTIIKRSTGNINVFSFDAGQRFIEKVCPFDTFIQILEGNAEVIINGNTNQLETGQSIVIPAHSTQTIQAPVRFKMLSTVIKSGYEEICADSIQ